jgi:hypothetical protein
MSNRLKLFRERMAAFEGAANPSEAIESGYSGFRSYEVQS